MLKFLKSIVVPVALLCSVNTYAGLTFDVPVTVDTTNSTAYGNYRTARFAADTVSFIGCGSGVIVQADGTPFFYGFCQATDSTGARAFCNIRNADIANKVGGISDYSYITFNWNADGDCTRLGVSTQSVYIPAGVE